jgi:hypothetical protein
VNSINNWTLSSCQHREIKVVSCLKSLKTLTDRRYLGLQGQVFQGIKAKKEDDAAGINVQLHLFLVQTPAA